MELQDYLKVVRKRWRVIVAVVLVCVGLAAAGSLASEKVYESRTQFFVSTTGAGDSGALLQGSTAAREEINQVYMPLLRQWVSSHPCFGNTGEDMDYFAMRAFEKMALTLTPEKVAEFQKAQEELKGSLSRLLVVAEQYPELKATENFTKLQGQLEGIENDVKSSRNAFNEAINTYNVKVRSFPGSLIAGILGFKAKEGFKADAGTEKAPEVKF